MFVPSVGKNVLIAGAGGGFDIFSGLPIYHQLRMEGKNVHLANYSFTDLRMIPVESDNVHPWSGKVTKCPMRGKQDYFPEGYLAEYLDKFENYSPSCVYSFPKIGVAPLKKAYEYLIRKLNLDTIILVDGGVDSLMSGNEQGCGTILEDAVSIAAVAELNVQNKILAAVGFGTEIEDGVEHKAVLRNMAELKDSLMGVGVILNRTLQFDLMKSAYNYVSSKPNHASSHITPKIIAAVEGKFGDLGNGEFISQLMPLIWYYDLPGVAYHSKIIDKNFSATQSFTDVSMLYRQKLQTIKLHKEGAIPL